MNDVLGTRRGSRKAQGQWPQGGPLTAAFNPASLITGAGGFWRADMGITQSSGNLTGWADQSSFSQNLANTSGSNQVAYGATNWLTSHPGLTVTDGSNQYIAAGPVVPGAGSSFVFPANAITSAFMLVQFTAATNNRCMQAAFGGSSPIGSPGFTSAYNGGVYWYSGGFIGNGGSAFTVALNTPILVGLVFDGANANLWINGSLQGSGTAFTSNIGAASNNTFGFGAVNANACGMIVAFGGITQKQMNSTDWGNLKTWSNSNWGTSF